MLGCWGCSSQIDQEPGLAHLQDQNDTAPPIPSSPATASLSDARRATPASGTEGSMEITPVASVGRKKRQKSSASAKVHNFVVDSPLSFVTFGVGINRMFFISQAPGVGSWGEGHYINACGSKKKIKIEERGTISPFPTLPCSYANGNALTAFTLMYLAINAGLWSQ